MISRGGEKLPGGPWGQGRKGEERNEHGNKIQSKIPKPALASKKWFGTTFRENPHLRRRGLVVGVGECWISLNMSIIPSGRSSHNLATREVHQRQKSLVARRQDDQHGLVFKVARTYTDKPKRTFSLLYMPGLQLLFVKWTNNLSFLDPGLGREKMNWGL